MAEAEDWARQEPGLALAWSELSQCWLQGGELELGLRCLDEALRRCPGSERAPLLHNRGRALLKSGRPAEAIGPLREALKLQPALVVAWTNLGVALREVGQPAAAITALQQATARAPRDPAARWNLALAELMAGRWSSGWRNYEARLSLPGFAAPALPQGLPLWKGEAVGSILLHGEQGLGDTLQLCRLLPLVRERVGGLTLAVQAPLVPLLATCDQADRVIPLSAAPPKAGAVLHLGSLPAAMALGSEALEGPPPALRLPVELRARWRAWLGPGPAIGLWWQGNPAYLADTRRSPPLAAYAPLLALRQRWPELRFISLQKGHGTEQIAGSTLPVEEPPGLDATAPFLDSAALMMELDGLVGSDTSLAHLAGLLGRPAQLLLPAVPDWRYGLSGERWPWWPSLRLHRQAQPGDWSACLRSATQALLSTR